MSLLCHSKRVLLKHCPMYHGHYDGVTGPHIVHMTVGTLISMTSGLVVERRESYDRRFVADVELYLLLLQTRRNHQEISDVKDAFSRNGWFEGSALQKWQHLTDSDLKDAGMTPLEMQKFRVDALFRGAAHDVDAPYTRMIRRAWEENNYVQLDMLRERLETLVEDLIHTIPWLTRPFGEDVDEPDAVDDADADDDDMDDRWLQEMRPNRMGGY